MWAVGAGTEQVAPKPVRFLLVLLAVTACTSVRPVHPALYIPAHRPPTVWVTYADYSFVPVDQPRIVGDTLKGVWHGLAEPLAIPLNEIQSVQAKQPDYERTVILFSTLAAAVGVVILIN